MARRLLHRIPVLRKVHHIFWTCSSYAVSRLFLFIINFLLIKGKQACLVTNMVSHKLRVTLDLDTLMSSMVFSNCYDNVCYLLLLTTASRWDSFYTNFNNTTISLEAKAKQTRIRAVTARLLFNGTVIKVIGYHGSLQTETNRWGSKYANLDAATNAPLCSLWNWCTVILEFNQYLNGRPTPVFYWTLFQ